MQPIATFHDDPPVSAAFRRAMRGFAATVTLITTAGADGLRHGMTATAVNSVSMEPPLLLACINRGASIHSPLRERGRLCVNILGGGHDALVSAFSGKLAGQARFGIGDWRDDDDGLPYLADAQSCLFCTVQSVVDASTHAIVLARVTSVRVAARIDPLVYLDGRFCSGLGAGPA